MSAAQKDVLYNLFVVSLTVVTVLSLVPLFGPGAQGGFGLLGLLGLRPFLFRRRQGGVVEDERDLAIRRRSLLIAYRCSGRPLSPPVWHFWRSTAGRGRCPGRYPIGRFFGLIIVVGVTSVSTLVMYGAGRFDAV